MSGCPTIDNVLTSYSFTNDQLMEDFESLKRDKVPVFAGNKILYHYQLINLIHTSRHNKESFYNAITHNPNHWWNLTLKYSKGTRPHDPGKLLFQMYQRLTGPISFFKPSIAISIYRLQNHPSHILDPCAGWGGRMISALAMGFKYTGIDTNISLKPAYDSMMERFGNATMIWDDSLNVDFSSIDYDCVLTSPPYWNTELYNNMPNYPTEASFYVGFLIPLIDKCRKHIRNNGTVYFNISPKMYKILLKYKYDPSDHTLCMRQNKIRGIDKQNLIYTYKHKE